MKANSKRTVSHHRVTHILKRTSCVSSYSYDFNKLHRPFDLQLVRPTVSSTYIIELQEKLIHRVQLAIEKNKPLAVFKMRLSSVFLILVVVISVVNCSRSSNFWSTKTCDDSRVIAAIKNLETKMDILIALVNKTSTPQPSGN